MQQELQYSIVLTIRGDKCISIDIARHPKGDGMNNYLNADVYHQQ